MNAIIVDDTQAAIDNLVDKLQKYPDVSVVATAGTGEEGLDMIMRHKPDLLFLDVELPDMTGIEFLSQFNDLAEWPCHVVIYTAYTDYMLPAFRNKAFDFLLKPVDDKELDTVISRFYEERDSEKAAVIKDDSIIKTATTNCCSTLIPLTSVWFRYATSACFPTITTRGYGWRWLPDATNPCA